MSNTSIGELRWLLTPRVLKKYIKKILIKLFYQYSISRFRFLSIRLIQQIYYQKISVITEMLD